MDGGLADLVVFMRLAFATWHADSRSDRSDQIDQIEQLLTAVVSLSVGLTECAIGGVKAMTWQ